MFNKEKNIHMPKYIKNNALKITLSIVSILTIIMLVLCIIPKNNIVKTMGKSFLEGLGIYTEEIETVWLDSDEDYNPGSWYTERTAKWISADTAELSVNLYTALKNEGNNKDIIIVLDTSGSMAGEKIQKAVYDAMELTDYTLSDENNRVALITFDTGSTIISPLTNEKYDILAPLYSMTVDGCTNYNAALQNVASIMEGYTKQDNRELITLFLTDGYPNEETPNQVGTYEALKDKYPYMTINGIQYEMGMDIINEIKQISDNQWVADRDTLINVLLEAAVKPEPYDNFSITDYIHNDYFTVESLDDIKVSKGNVNLEYESDVPKITWDFGNELLTGSQANMKIKLKLKQQYVGNEGFYPTSKNEEVNYKISGESAQSISSTETPVLKNTYEVYYYTNTPSGCSLPSIPSETHYIYQNVTKRNDKLSCEGYLFKGWEVSGSDSKDATKINDEMFVMPGHDVTVRAIWSKPTVTKSMGGDVVEKATLYKVLKDETANYYYARKFTGTHQDSMDPTRSKKDIYLYYANSSDRAKTIDEKNNVIFANQCWKMYRTTDTGGVKMIYNGEAVDDKCLNTRENHVGYDAASSEYLNSSYWYGTDYTYDSTTGKFSLTGDKEEATWSDSTATNLIGKYTCESSNEYDTCTSLYLVEAYISSNKANVIKIGSNAKFDRIGKLQFNVDYDDYSYGTSLAYVGYMHGTPHVDKTIYNRESKWLDNEIKIYGYNMYATSITNFWYADSYSYNSTTGRYELVNPYLGSSVANKEDLVGKYTFERTSSSASFAYIYYVAGLNGSNDFLTLELNNNKPVTDYTLSFSDSYSDNGDGTYTLDNPTTIPASSWATDYESYVGKYMCDDKGLTCTNIGYIYRTYSRTADCIKANEKMLIAKERDGLNLSDTLLVKYIDLYNNPENYSDYKYTCGTTSATCTDSNLLLINEYGGSYLSVYRNYYYGSSVTWDGTNYTLVDTVGIENNTNYSNNHHYVCPTPGEKSCPKVRFIYMARNGSGYLYTIELSNGESLDDALNTMLNNNDINSIAKSGIEAWYKKYLLDYDKYIEDTIYCNDREIKKIGPYTENGNLDSSIEYNGYSTLMGGYCPSNTSCKLTCTDIEDKFSINNPAAPLKYKVGMMTAGEENLGYYYYPKGNDDAFWLMSPTYSHYVENIGGGVGGNSTYYKNGVRPVISLRPGIEYIDGDGTTDNPYIIDTNS